MYNFFFNFSESPFENNIDQRFLFLSEDYKEVLAALLYFIKTRRGSPLSVAMSGLARPCS